jgi:signal transduction histidine kinase/ActR/RegA family two-component response regulator
MNALPPSSPEALAEPGPVVRIRRDYNTWVSHEMEEDGALRLVPPSRRWKEKRVLNAALGGAPSLMLEAIGATMLVECGFINAFWAILAAGLIVFLMGLPICHAAARHGLDMDLLTRGAGFGYIGAMIGSLIHISFTFIFFALEAAILAHALEWGLGLPPLWGYLLCALAVIPLAARGIATISRWQAWTRSLWLALLVLPFAFLLTGPPESLRELAVYAGVRGEGKAFSMPLFGAALSLGLALLAQMGKQADSLRFMPEPDNPRRWWAALIIGGPGWIVPGAARMLGGALLAYLALRSAVPVEKAVDPGQMYLTGFSRVFSDSTLAVGVTVLFVAVAQIGSQLSNAHAGSLAWASVFIRITRSHPGRFVWIVFNTLIALLLMELDVFQAQGVALGLYSNLVLSWMAAVLADLLINKPLGLSPRGIEFRRSRLHDINPVGVGATGLASLLSLAAFSGLFGEAARPCASFIALFVAFTASPLIAWKTGGRYYLARREPDAPGSGRRCVICERDYDSEDTTHCPACADTVCSLCCSLDAHCEEACRPEARLGGAWRGLSRRLWPPCSEARAARRFLRKLAIALPVSALLALLYTHEALSRTPHLRPLLLLAGIGIWWLALVGKSWRVAREEAKGRMRLLTQEIASRQRADEQLQKAKQAADQANLAKSRYITAISHELRTPLNSILGYAQILADDPTTPPRRRRAVDIIRQSGDHLLSVIESTVDIARIESGRMMLEAKPFGFPEFLRQIVGMFELQARGKGLSFHYEPAGEMPPVVRADRHRLRQILINVLGNAVKFTVSGRVEFCVEFRHDIAVFEIRDTGPGIAEDDIGRIFDPFVRGRAARAGGSGVGLSIARMLVTLMGGEMTVKSLPGEGSRFRIRLFLPQVHDARAELEPSRAHRVGYAGIRRRVLVVDNEKLDRELLQNVLAPLGFQIEQAGSGEECLQIVGSFAPHLILMDLAMPGMDGWETIRRLRGMGIEAHIAVVSANAFEKDQDNEASIGAEDFLVKPLRVDDLVDWIGRRLDIEWIHARRAVAPSPEPAPPAPLVAPDAPALLALDELIDLGYVRGIHDKLSEIEAHQPASGEFVVTLRALLGRFQFDAMKEILRKARDDA